MELYILYNNLKHFSTVLRQMTIDINKKITTSSIHNYGTLMCSS